jgi:hypothetical protein
MFASIIGAVVGFALALVDYAMFGAAIRNRILGPIAAQNFGVR